MENSSLVCHPRNTYEGLGKTLGKGTFGKVKLGTHQITKEKAAIKILDKSMIKDASDLERVNREISILKKLRHPHVVQLFDVSAACRHYELYRLSRMISTCS